MDDTEEEQLPLPFVISAVLLHIISVGPQGVETSCREGSDVTGVKTDFEVNEGRAGHSPPGYSTFFGTQQTKTLRQFKNLIINGVDRGKSWILIRRARP
ncbi:hypothetical protein AVEN_160571-1 [Araneus ventricosus]|uniref:Uncharacterized protein n=1 Tax=Araneus ventricosus TaxID=182803 RepID=A0A4Y2W7F1_ARAVE|nr:hypothetical protein AVEN_171038-1 [Araneus ventricosus]GBO33613.1 hypothetical protein AVEN_160571-1 [Araneus ventricosus]